MYVSTLIMIIKKYIEIGKKTEYYDSFVTVQIDCCGRTFL